MDPRLVIVVLLVGSVLGVVVAIAYLSWHRLIRTDEEWRADPEVRVRFGSPQPEEELVTAVREWLGPTGIQYFREVRATHGELNAVWVEDGIPHPVHFREGMRVRNKLRELTDQAWTDEEYDDRWIPIVEAAIAPVETGM